MLPTFPTFLVEKAGATFDFVLLAATARYLVVITFFPAATQYFTVCLPTGIVPIAIFLEYHLKSYQLTT